MVFNDDLVNFFKRHNLYNEEMFKYFSDNSIMIDYRYKEQRAFVGCLIAQDKDDYLLKFCLCIPYVYDDITMLVSIHELVHGTLMYKSLGKKINIGIDSEALPMLYEKIYINERNTKELTEYGNKLDSMIDKEKKEYVFGLLARDELFNSYNYDIDKMEKKVKKLAKKYKMS